MMLTRIQICWLWLLLFLGNPAVAATDCAVQTDIPQNQCQALLDLYHSTGGANWFTSDLNPAYEVKNDWNVTNTPCSWVGVTCWGNSVAEIDLSMIWQSHLVKGLTGTLPNSLAHLTELTALDLSYNHLSGEIPTLPTGLISLNLSVNQLTGTIPTLPSGLIFLNLYSNQLSGTLPTLPDSLNFLNLSDNQLTGTLPTLPSALISLHLYGNQLTGTIPTLPNSLNFLNLAKNQLTGTIPFLPEGLTLLDLSNNQLVGTVPNLPARLVYSNLQGNQQIEATNCATQTDIPQNQCQALVDLYNATDGAHWLNTPNNWNVTNTPCHWAGITCNHGSVTELKLPENHLSGTLPASLFKELPDLQVLMLNDNGLSGTISVLPTQLTSLDLGGNYLTGVIPTLPEGLVRLGLERNQLTGSIPKLPAALTYINLFGNQLTGTVPELPAGLKTLWLSTNQLTGTLPELPAGLESLNLGDNQFTGTLPNLPLHLTYLDLRNNQWLGSIPNLPESLISLDLSHNQLTGTIPNLPNTLTYVNLSYNQLSGTIPAPPIALQEARGLMNLSNNPLTGTAPTLPSDLSYYIDLSNTLVGVSSPSGVPVVPSNNGTASEAMSNYGQVANNLTVTETGSVSGGTLTGTITNKGLMANVTIAPQAMFSGGKLSGFNLNQGTVSDVKISQYSEIVGGNYSGIIHNAGFIFNPTLLENAVVGGGQLVGTVRNQGTVHDVYFAAQTQVVGGKLTGEIIGNSGDSVIIGEAELDAAKISNACLTVTVQVNQTVELINTIQHTATDLTQLTPEDFCIEPHSLAHFTAHRLAATEKLAFSSFTAQHLAELPIAALTALTATQLAHISSAALQGFSVEQFQAIPIATLAGLHKNNMDGLAPQVIRSIDQPRLQALTATEFQQMSSFGVAKWLTHLNNQLTVADLTPLLPTGWKLSETGQITAPDDTVVALKSLEISPIPQLELPSYQFDLNSTFSIGGQVTEQAVLKQMNDLLLQPESGLTQTKEGILIGNWVRPFAFIVNPKQLWQRSTQSYTIVQLLENHVYQLMTVEHLEINLSPVPKDPAEMLKILGEQAQAVIGAQGDVFLNWEQEHAQQHLVALFNPFSDPVSAPKSPGLYLSDKQAQFIYSDGTAQMLYPTVFDPDSFIAEAKKFPGVEAVRFNMDGTFEVMYQGQKLQLLPNFAVKVTELEPYQQVKPSVKLISTGVQYQVQHGQQLLTSELLVSQ